MGNTTEVETWEPRNGEMFINSRPYDLVHRIRDTTQTREVNEEGYTVHSVIVIRTYCGVKLYNNKWMNTNLSRMSFNCKRCKNKEPK